MQSRHTSPILAERYPVAFLTGLADIVLVVTGAYLAHYIRFSSLDLPHNYGVATLTIALTNALCQTMLGNYASWRGQKLVRQLGRVYTAWFVAIALLTGTAVLLKVSSDYSRIWLSTTLLTSIFLITLLRLGIFSVLRRIRTKGRNLKAVIVVESGFTDAELNDTLPALAEYGYQVVQRICVASDVGWITSLVASVTAKGAHEVWLRLPINKGEEIKKVLYALRHLTVEVRYMPDLGDLPLLNHKISHIAGMYSIDISCSPMAGPSRLMKRAEDIVIGAIISILVLPLCLAIAIAIKISSPGPVIFKQYRTGINGRKFKVYKFRSMEVHTESTGHVTQASFGDPRITQLGSFLRRTSLDELPQFFNVLQGRMSIVGPRPHALAHNEYYKDLVESYMKRHKVKPGITGWAQVNGYRGETDTLEKMQRRVEHDLWYIDNWSLSLDIKIIIRTLYKGFLNNKP
ncbi:undecaprenyl-phosphate glucose phosphotransferase [Pusillimonas noertemannii]|uniref:undecaprenyl-phosphate glucose phosphotransferase n=1 Tax=Pusillimonas noertemannii TaxID=305977 RepID=UPI000310DA11|nr:undecaprenyl-phosphate glucose phosphotransferase [Pusillimonas noertemannii]